eukprot:scaffold55961_cov56-Cyclotella_meneghiniana.AAC.2
MPRVRSDRVYPTTYPISLVPDVKIPEYLPEHGLGQRAIPGYLPEESNYSGSKPRQRAISKIKGEKGG